MGKAATASWLGSPEARCAAPRSVAVSTCQALVTRPPPETAPRRAAAKLMHKRWHGYCTPPPRPAGTGPGTVPAGRLTGRGVWSVLGIDPVPGRDLHRAVPGRAAQDHLA